MVKPAEELGDDRLPLGARGAAQPSLDILHAPHHSFRNSVRMIKTGVKVYSRDPGDVIEL